MLDGIRNHSQSIWVKIAFGLIILVFVFWGIGSMQSVSTGVARINGVEISEQEYLQAYNEQLNTIRASIPNITDEQLKQMNFPSYVLESLAIQTIFQQEAQRIGMTITPRELYEVISQYPFTHDANGKFNLEVYEKAVANAGQTPKTFEESIKKSMLQAKFAEILAPFAYASETQARQLYEYNAEQRAFDAVFVADADFIDSVNPSDDDLKVLYESTKQNYMAPASINLEYIEVSPSTLAKVDAVTDVQIQEEYTKNPNAYDIPENVTASHLLILLPQGSTEEQEAEVLAEIKDIQAKLAEGADFAELAKEFSDDVVSGQNGGELGTFVRGQMVPEFEEVAFSQAVGTISEPVRTQFGYHLINVTGKEAAKPLSDEEKKEIIGKVLAEKEALSRVQTVVDSLLVQVNGNSSFADAALKEGLKVKSTGTIPFELLASSYNITTTDIEALKQTVANTVLSNPISANNALLVARVVENNPAQAQAFEQVKESVRAESKQSLAHQKAKESALELLKDTSKIDSTTITESTIDRQGITSFGVTVPLKDVIFEAPENTWLADAYAVDNGYIIVKPAEIIPANEEDWDIIKINALRQIEQSRMDMLFSLYLQELRSLAEIEILNELYFQ